MISTKDAVLLLRKWKEDNCLLRFRGEFSGGLLEAVCRVVDVSDEKVSFLSLDEAFRLTFLFSGNFVFEYAERKDISPEGQDNPEESGLAVVALDGRFAFLFVAS